MRIRSSSITVAAVCAAAVVAVAPASGDAAGLQLKSDVVTISSADVQKCLTAVSDDSSEYAFKCADGNLRSLQPGKVMLLQGSDVEKVTAVRSRGSGLLVSTVPAEIGDVVDSGSIDYSGTPDAEKMFVVSDASSNPDSSDVERQALRAYMGDYRARARSHVPAVPVTVAGKVGDYSFSLAFTAEDGGRFSYTGLVGYKKDLLGAEIKLSGDLQFGHDTVELGVNRGIVTNSQMSFSEMVAHTEFTYTLTSGSQARVGDPPVLRIPVGVNIPVPAPVPMFVKFQAAVLIKFGFTSYGASMSGGSTVTVSGSSAEQQHGSNATTTGDNSAAGGVLDHEAGQVGPSSSALPSGVNVAFQLPKLGIGLGISPLNELWYVSLVTSVAQVTQAAALGLGATDCSAYVLDVSLSSGFETQFGPLSIGFPAKTLHEWGPVYVTETGCPSLAPKPGSGSSGSGSSGSGSSGSGSSGSASGSSGSASGSSGSGWSYNPSAPWEAPSGNPSEY